VLLMMALQQQHWGARLLMCCYNQRSVADVVLLMFALQAK
jgi:hypothetical protein